MTQYRVGIKGLERVAPVGYQPDNKGALQPVGNPPAPTISYRDLSKSARRRVQAALWDHVRVGGRKWGIYVIAKPHAGGHRIIPYGRPLTELMPEAWKLVTSIPQPGR